jgi:hypothetical protein
MVIEEKAKKVENEVENEIENETVSHFKLKLLYRPRDSYYYKQIPRGVYSSVEVLRP